MRHASAVVAALVAFLVAACTEGNGATTCLPEDVSPCSCQDGSKGYMVCDPEAGSAYGMCDCSGASPYLPEAGSEDAAADGGEGGESGASCAALPLAFMCPCVNDTDCTTGICGQFPAKGPHCTKVCAAPTDCPAPSPGCNNMGECKAP